MYGNIKGKRFVFDRQPSHFVVPDQVAGTTGNGNNNVELFFASFHQIEIQ